MSQPPASGVRQSAPSSIPRRPGRRHSLAVKYRPTEDVRDGDPVYQAPSAETVSDLSTEPGLSAADAAAREVVEADHQLFDLLAQYTTLTGDEIAGVGK